MKSNAIFFCGILTFSVAAFASAGLTSRNHDSRLSTEHGSSDPDEHGLIQFGDANPSCQLWTNWRRLCSRLGPAGSTKCISDAHYQVRPTEPFCVAGAWHDMPWYVADTAPQSQSRLRFCEEFDTEEYGDRHVTICRRYTSQRPFNGTRLDTLYDKRCEIVRSTSSTADLCRNPSSSPGSDCRKAFSRKRVSHPLYCAQWKSTTGCETPVMSIPPPSAAGGLIVGHTPDLNGSPVWGSYCLTPEK